MDEISLLRRTRDDIPERAPDQVTRGRADLFRAIEDESPSATATRSRRRRRGFAWAGFSTLGAGALAVALVAGNILGAGAPGGPGGADAAAASVLESAALATLKASDLVVGPGQYLLLKTDGAHIAMSTEGGDDFPWYISGTHDELYIPADRDDDWFWIQCERSALQTFGPESERMAADYAAADEDTFRVAPHGSYYEGAPIDSYDFDELPRDPQKLLERIYVEIGSQGPTREDAALGWIADLLRNGTVPADLRASLYKAATGIPGVSVTEQQATLNGSTGIAIGRESSDRRRDLIIDPATGQYIGSREVSIDGFGSVPAGTVLSSEAVTTSVVDAAPTGPAVCAQYR
jgi:hypothetical protein